MNVNLPLGDRLNLPDLVSAAIPEDRKHGSSSTKNGKKKVRDTNVAILSDNWTSPSSGMNRNDPNFLSDSFPRNPPRIYIIAESPTFDTQTLKDWMAEGFHVEYLYLGDDVEQFKQQTLRHLHKKGLGPCEPFGIIAFGEAASVCLEYYHVLDNNPELKLGLLIGYYPSRIPDPNTRFPSAIRVLVHLAVGEIGVVKQSQMVGIQGKKRVTKGNVDRGTGVGGMLGMGYQGYAYEVEAGFAEHDLDEYDGICAELAWSRSLAAAKKALRPPGGDIEALVEVNTHGRLYARNVQQAMSAYSNDNPHVTYTPTLTGATGTAALEDFYSRHFINNNPPSLQFTLLSRTVGVDRVVDEMYVSFKHTQEMPWILPGVPPTNKRVEIAIVSIVALKGGKLHHEHVYWDQASVLMQVGLLDPKLVPLAAEEKGVDRLPVVGKKAARRVFACGDEDGEADNALIGELEEDGADGHSKDGDATKENEKTNGSDKKLTKRPKEKKAQVGEKSDGPGSTAGHLSDKENGYDGTHQDDETGQEEKEDKEEPKTRHATVEDEMSPEANN